MWLAEPSFGRLQRSDGQRLVASSETAMEYVWPRSVNTLFGWSCTVGAWWAVGTLPSRIDGTENVVFSWTLVAFGYHVPPSCTNRVKPGKRCASMWSRLSISSCTGNASNVTSTIGGRNVSLLSQTL